MTLGMVTSLELEGWCGCRQPQYFG